MKKILVHFFCPPKATLEMSAFRVEAKGDEFSGQSSRNLFRGYFAPNVLH